MNRSSTGSDYTVYHRKHNVPTCLGRTKHMLQYRVGKYKTCTHMLYDLHNTHCYSKFARPESIPLATRCLQTCKDSGLLCLTRLINISVVLSVWTSPYTLDEYILPVSNNAPNKTSQPLRFDAARMQKCYDHQLSRYTVKNSQPAPDDNQINPSAKPSSSPPSSLFSSP